jgi:hypothetical protein
MKWNQFFGGVLVGAAFGIMVGAAYGPGSPDKVTTSTAGFCSMLALAGVAAARSRLKGTAKEPASNAAGPGLDDKTQPAR